MVPAPRIIQLLGGGGRVDHYHREFSGENDDIQNVLLSATPWDTMITVVSVSEKHVDDY